MSAGKMLGIISMVVFVVVRLVPCAFGQIGFGQGFESKPFSNDFGQGFESKPFTSDFGQGFKNDLFRNNFERGF